MVRRHWFLFFFIICIGNNTFSQSFSLTPGHQFEIDGNYSSVDSVLVGCYSGTGWGFQFQPLDIPFSILDQTSCNYLTLLVPEKQPIIIKKVSLSSNSQFSCVDNLNTACSFSIQPSQIIKFHLVQFTLKM